MVEDIATGRAEAADEALRAREIAAAPPGGEASPPFALAAALAASAAALAACGGGGGGSGGAGMSLAGLGGSSTVQAGSLTALANTPTAQTYVYTQAKTDDEAARFLLQSQFSASEADIAAVRSKGYLPWLGEQVDRPAEQGGRDWILSKPYNTVNSDDMIWNQLMTSPDGFRKRMALVFTEIFVVSRNDIGSNWAEHMMAQYWDTLVAGVTTNFRKLLEDVSLNPAMGFYLNTKGNQKENAQGRQPDENYAREVMQLMTIGLYQLEADGSVKTGSDGVPLDSYSQDDVTNLARVFTGYDLDIRADEKNGTPGAFTPPGGTGTIESSAWTSRPMALTASRHSTLEARFLGATVPGGTEGKAALKIALDTLFGHPNVGPFICKQLIQRLVTSNPSPAYVKRVSDVFADNGGGVRGDMKSVFAAVLLDNEARSPAGLSDPNFGRLREPMLRLAQWARTFGAGSTSGNWKVGDLSRPNDQLGQSPLRSPSVFNFFRPGYVPPSTALAASRLVAPEFQLVNETSVGGYLNFLQSNVLPKSTGRDVNAAYASELALVLDPAALVQRLNLLLTGNQLSAATQALITSALANPPVNGGSSDAVKLNRVYAAVLLVMASPSYLIQK
ncbi:DUF1800 domain-containing protein [Variovorax saccharolyticus]|uniref:DUF1800 domain-containing protein n=1 Tax=Variovorax saccharolyticus TaxID=3053516 RepID=UPI002578E944|nr:DUF1800 domain-containing protein [Variovorax sp. J22R187]MDM0019856.1 DUF1800 domain-containing protein [Variovorax sp. J22R187]